jgi:hypothetical protein
MRNLFEEYNAMNTYSILDLEDSSGCVRSTTTDQRYAWLEQEGGMWHLLTNLFANPGEATRRWSNKHNALEELANEGWAIVYPYSEKPPVPLSSCDHACGYGLMWIGQ